MTNNLTTAFVAKVMAEHGYRVMAGPDTPVLGGAADSRSVHPGDLFTAFPGENADGNAFVGQALENGAVAAICERVPEGTWPDRTIVVAPDATKAVGELAHAWRKEWGGPVVGITGTVGKTTAKDITAAVLAHRLRVHKSEGNFNSREGLPLALMSLRRDHEVSVLEMGMDSAGEIEYLRQLADPQVGVVLNIGLTHVSKLGSIEAIEREKLSLVRNLPQGATAVINLEDARIARAAAGLHCRVLSFGKGPEATLGYGDLKVEGLRGVRFYVKYGEKTARTRSSVPGEHAVPGAVAAMGVGLALGMSLVEAANALRRAEIPGRARVALNPMGVTIVDDRYNSGPASLRGALEMLRYARPRRIALIGRMAELGAFEEEEHRRAGAEAANTVDILVTFGPTCVVLAEAAREAGLRDVRWFEDKDAAAGEVRREMRPGDTVLVKASRGEALETVLPLLEGAA